MIDQLTYVNDAHVRTLIAGLDRAAAELMKATPVGRGVVFFRKRTNPSNSLATSRPRLTTSPSCGFW